MFGGVTYHMAAPYITCMVQILWCYLHYIELMIALCFTALCKNFITMLIWTPCLVLFMLCFHWLFRIWIDTVVTSHAGKTQSLSPRYKTKTDGLLQYHCIKWYFRFVCILWRLQCIHKTSVHCSTGFYTLYAAKTKLLLSLLNIISININTTPLVLVTGILPLKYIFTFVYLADSCTVYFALFNSYCVTFKLGPIYFFLQN